MNTPVSSKRLPSNTNLHLHFDPYFDGCKVMSEKGPLVREYLHSLLRVVRSSLDDHPRTYAVRLELYFPKGVAYANACLEGRLMERFIARLRERIESDKLHALKQGKRRHETRVRYVWAREFHKDGRMHYHLLLLLNNDAYRSLGRLVTDNVNLFCHIQDIWADLLKLQFNDARGLVNVTNDGSFFVNANGKGFLKLIYGASYMCKAATKVYGGGSHAFGCSRI